MARRRRSWVGLGMDAWLLGAEAATVIGMRSMKIAAGGPGADIEAKQMVSEKIEAAATLQMMAMTGALGFTPAGIIDKSLKHYRRKVSANRRRLARG